MQYPSDIFEFENLLVAARVVFLENQSHASLSRAAGTAAQWLNPCIKWQKNPNFFSLKLPHSAPSWVLT